MGGWHAVGKLFLDSPVARAAAVMLGNSFDHVADFLIGALAGSRFCSVIVTAAGDGPVGCHDRWIGGCRRSFAGVELGSGVEDDYGFFEMSFSCLRREFSRRRVRVQLPLIE